MQSYGKSGKLPNDQAFLFEEAEKRSLPTSETAAAGCDFAIAGCVSAIAGCDDSAATCAARIRSDRLQVTMCLPIDIMRN